jgi:hypothetical protein
MLSRIVYTSKSLCDTQEALRLRDQARILNARLDVTGALYLANGMFLQFLEGQEETISALFERIRGDARHTDCLVLDRRQISTRVFPGRFMAWLPASSEAVLLLKTIVAQNAPVASLDGSSAGAFFYAMSRLQNVDSGDIRPLIQLPI